MDNHKNIVALVKLIVATELLSSLVPEVIEDYFNIDLDGEEEEEEDE